jgi:hypothetical protein
MKTLRVTLPRDYPKEFQGVIQQLQRIFDEQSQTNSRLSEMSLDVVESASSAPATGNYKIGQFVANTARHTELGVTPKYTIFGWVCKSSSPLQWLEQRFLTGN